MIVKKVAVILSGCGVYDGAEIHESVLTLLAITRYGARYQCFAPDMAQSQVINHLTGEVSEGEQRNVLVEAARIARGDIQPLNELKVADYDALFLPGGFGAAKNLCSFAFDGADAEVQPEVLKACRAFADANKPAGYACIAPALLPQVYGAGVRLTIGNDKATAEMLNAMGAEHVNCVVTDVVVDKSRNLVTTPAYMLAESIVDAAEGIEKMVRTVLEL